MVCFNTTNIETIILLSKLYHDKVLQSLYEYFSSMKSEYFYQFDIFGSNMRSFNYYEVFFGEKE